ncbi:HYR domain-containing protein [Aureisphaera galaxeae]|uniref:HYR domain-containing protein n=1 Tax=Aureisphaera galaxeae TaxID=1538023 RepID=UPI0023504A9F|nr:HYR domain-containing protein [Aureisphaera galaxeae]MDC8002464.1 HYR domain-containing protein [Aureisphaera galaxeae]
MKNLILFCTLLVYCSCVWGQYTIDDTDTTPFEDIAATGIALEAHDESEDNVALPFTFQLGDRSSTDIRIGNNGGLLFDRTFGNLTFENRTLSGISPRIVAFWDDLDDPVGDVYYEIRGTEPNRRCIIQWDEMPHYELDNGETVTFQIVLYEGSNEIVFVYEDVFFSDSEFDQGASATIGLVSGYILAEYSLDSPMLNDGDAIRFIPHVVVGNVPEITCPVDMTVNNDPGECGAIVNFPNATATDVEDGTAMVTQILGPPSGSFLEQGEETVVFQATDSDGNVSFCEFTITVNVIDTEAPVAVCQDVVFELNASGTVGVSPSDFDGGSTDNCDITVRAIDAVLYTCEDLGDNIVNFTVYDIDMNSDSCTAIATVVDNLAPTVICAVDDAGRIIQTGDPLGQSIPESGSTGPMIPSVATISETGIIGTDYELATVELDITHSWTGDIEITLISPSGTELELSDENGGFGEDYTNTVFRDGGADITLAEAPFTGTFEPEEGTFSETFMGEPIEGDWVLDIYDDTSGDDGMLNSFTIRFDSVTLGGGPARFSLDDSGSILITPDMMDDGSYDNCGVVEVDVAPNTFDCSQIGLQTVTLAVLDGSGNSSSCTTEVLIEDTTPPELICQDITVVLNDSGSATITTDDVIQEVTDNCGVASSEIDTDTFDCSNVGTNDVTVTAFDNSGNSITCMVTVTVVDDMAPDLVCSDIIIFLDENGNATLVPEDVIASNTDNCDVQEVQLDSNEFDCSDIENPVMVTVSSEDLNGNMSTCLVEVTVKDIIAPELVCPEDQIEVIEAGTLFEVPDYFALGDVMATDNCTDPITEIEQDPSPGTQLSQGTYTVSIAVTDESGNESTCSFELDVQETLNVSSYSDLSSVRLFPIPTTDILNIANPEQLPLEKLTFYDILGRPIKSFDLENMGQHKLLDISQLGVATYIVKIEGQGKVKVINIIKN